MRNYLKWLLVIVLLIGLAQLQGIAQEVLQPQLLPTGMLITPTAASGAEFESLNPGLADLPQFTVDHPVSTAISPDGNTLLVLTSGYNRNNDENGKAIKSQSNEYVFVYDITGRRPRKLQALPIPNSFVGLAWNPAGTEFYASGGPNDVIHVFERENDHWREAAASISLGHKSGLGIKTRPVVAGLAVDPTGSRLLAANYANDSVSLVDLKTRKKIAELDLRPGKNNSTQKGIAGGEYPFWPVFCGNDKAYVSSLRDREIVVLDLKGTPRIMGRIKVRGQPNRMLVNRAQTLLFASVDNSDSVMIVDTKSDRLLATINTIAPKNIFPNPRGFKGSNPNSLALSPDERTLYVTNGGTNSMAVISLAEPPARSGVEALLPTGWYPTSVSVSRDGSMIYVANGKSDAGPNPKGCRNSFTTGERRECVAAGQYILQLQKGGLLSFPLPDKSELTKLTQQVSSNNHFVASTDHQHSDAVFQFLRTRIKHVIYIIKENRTYDQVLGDLEKGNGDPSLTLFKEPLAPNHHELARKFVTFDNFYDSGDVSGDGWNWSSAARVTDTVEKTIPMNYASRKITYDVEGENRGINVSVPSQQERLRLDPRHAELPDPEDQLPGTADVAAPDSSQGEAGAGYLWDAALRAGLTVRNYGFYLDLGLYCDGPEGTPVIVPLLYGFYVDIDRYCVGPNAIPLMRDPAATHTRVAFPVSPRLHNITDPYFRGFDQRFADYWRFKEWEREFDGYVKGSTLPALELLRLPHDHFGSFKQGQDGVNTVETEMADNDYALGLVVEKLAHSRYAKDTLIFVVEDDAQNGPDHVDAHRSLVFIAGPYVKQGALVSKHFNTVSLLRTMEEILGLPPLGINDALQPPMTEAFSTSDTPWTYTARVPEILRSTQLPLPARTASAGESAPIHDAAYWDQQTEGLDFSAEDRVDSERFNRVLWKGLMGEDVPYPAYRNGRDLRENREELLKNR